MKVLNLLKDTIGAIVDLFQYVGYYVAGAAIVSVVLYGVAIFFDTITRIFY